MKTGELRFFLNWQMSKETSSSLFSADSDSDRSAICNRWLAETDIANKFYPKAATNE